MPETGIEPVRPLFTKRRILSPMCLPISPLGHSCIVKQKSPDKSICEASRDKIEPGSGGATQSRTGLDGFAIRCITDLLSRQNLDKKGKRQLPFFKYGAGKESRTLDLNLGKVALYQLSYSRVASP